MRYLHVDVFSSRPLSGNGLIAAFPEKPLPDETLLEITRECKQFETIFIYPRDANGAFPVRIFTVDEELLFAGHPVIGAGAVIHSRFLPDDVETDIALALGERNIAVHSVKKENSYQVTMNQGEPAFLKTVDRTHYGKIAEALSIRPDDIDETLPVETVSTGLPYLIVPLRSNLAKSGIARKDFETFLARFDAKFVYVFDPSSLECRTWDNVANTEDVATGSAAGPLCAYLVKNKIKEIGGIIDIHQGKYVGRPSVIKGWVGCENGREEVFITGEVAFFASGTMTV